MPAWILWGIILSGGSAAYFWRKSHPTASLNPLPTVAPMGTGTVKKSSAITYQGKTVRYTVFSDGTARFSGPGIDFFAQATDPPSLLKVNEGSPADAQTILDSLG